MRLAPEKRKRAVRPLVNPSVRPWLAGSFIALGCGGQIDKPSEPVAEGGGAPVGVYDSVKVDWWKPSGSTPFEEGTTAQGGLIFETPESGSALQFSPEDASVESARVAIAGLSLDSELPASPETVPGVCEYRVDWDRDADGSVDGSEVRRYDASAQLLAGDLTGEHGSRYRIIIERDANGAPMVAVARYQCSERSHVEDGRFGPFLICESLDSDAPGILVSFARTDGRWVADVVYTAFLVGPACDRLDMSADGRLFTRQGSSACEGAAQLSIERDAQMRLLRYEVPLGNQESQVATATHDGDGRSTITWTSGPGLARDIGEDFTTEPQTFVQSRDASGRVVRMEYDATSDGVVDQMLDQMLDLEYSTAGRPLSERTDLDVDGIIDLRRTWDYDSEQRLEFFEIRNMTAPGDRWLYRFFDLETPATAIETSRAYDSQGRLESILIVRTEAAEVTGEPVGQRTTRETRQYGSDGYSVERHRIGDPNLGDGNGSPVEELVHCTWTDACAEAFPEDITAPCRYGELYELLLPPYDELPWPRVDNNFLIPPFIDTSLEAVVGYPWY